MKKVSENIFWQGKATLPPFKLPPFVLLEQYAAEIFAGAEVVSTAESIIRKRHAESCETGKAFMKQFKIIDLPF